MTARLWHSGRPHRLELEGAGVVATATGTVYSLMVREYATVVHVDRGTVEVRDADGVHIVAAGGSWHTDGRTPDPLAASTLLALADREPMPAVAAAPDAGIVDARVDAPLDAATIAAPTPAPTAMMNVKERWRRARLLRSQGKYPEAVDECVAIAAMNDPVWGPIALVEAIRIEVGALSDPARAVALVDQMLATWPHAALAPEARSLRCHALAELGRDGECSGSAAP